MVTLINGLVRFIQGIWQNFFEKPAEQGLQRLLAGDLDFLFSQVIKIIIPLVVIFMLVDLLMNMKALRKRRDQRRRSVAQGAAPKPTQDRPRRGWISRMVFEDVPVNEDDLSSDMAHPPQDVTENLPERDLLPFGVKPEDSVVPKRKSRTAEVMRNARRSLAQDVALAEETLPKQQEKTQPSRPGSMTGVTAPLSIQEVIQALAQSDVDAADERSDRQEGEARIVSSTNEQDVEH